jgi:hypothetical protein
MSLADCPKSVPEDQKLRLRAANALPALQDKNQIVSTLSAVAIEGGPRGFNIGRQSLIRAFWSGT